MFIKGRKNREEGSRREGITGRKVLMGGINREAPMFLTD